MTAAVAMTEDQLQAAILEAADWFGFSHYHTRDSRRSAAGFPDLVLVNRKTGRLIFAELKADKGRVSTAQWFWLDLLGIKHEAYLWRPADWLDGTVRGILSGRRP